MKITLKSALHSVSTSIRSEDVPSVVPLSEAMGPINLSAIAVRRFRISRDP